MRKTFALWKVSPPRVLLLLLLIQLFLDFAAPKERTSLGLSSSSDLYVHVTGGNTLVRVHNLRSKCSSHFLSMGFKRKIKADATQETAYTLLEFQSDPSGGGLIKIKGLATKRYLCFSLKGKLIDRRVPGNQQMCLFKERSIHGYTELVSAVNDKWKVGFNKKGKRLPGQFEHVRNQKNCYLFQKESPANSTKRP